jgi:hypothetical protein
MCLIFGWCGPERQPISPAGLRRDGGDELAAPFLVFSMTRYAVADCRSVHCAPRGKLFFT